MAAKRHGQKPVGPQRGDITLTLLAAISQAAGCQTAKMPSPRPALIPMLRLTEIKLPLEHPESALHEAILTRLGISADELLRYQVFKRSPDARRKSAIQFIYSVDVELADEAGVLARLAGQPHISRTPDMAYRFVAQAPTDLQERPVVVGFGPCGILAALLLAQMGFRPIVLERGRAVRERTQDTWGLWRKQKLDPESNVQFGEGGAGTFSDGKLYSQIKDPRFLTRKVLAEFVKAGAPEEILWINRPHIGTFRLVGMVEKMRAEIIALGGEIRFQSKVDDFLIEDGQIVGVKVGDEVIASRHVILAVGHSARDTFERLHASGIYVEPKPFAIGFRIEHPQSLIDECRYGPFAGHELLGAADYKLVYHAKNGRAVYSFCMCPGGTVVAATSEEGRVVTNGMSQYSRNERNANAGLVVNVNPEDFGATTENPLAGIAFQRQWESRAFELGGRNYFAPAQRVGDFLAARASTALGSVEPSYKPGVTPTDLATALPDYVIEAMREAIPQMAKQIRGYDLPDAVLTGVETRTSSPIRIRRGPDYQSVNTRGLYPGGEGAGYAGGIMSAAVDGIELAEAVALSITGQSR